MYIAENMTPPKCPEYELNHSENRSRSRKKTHKTKPVMITSPPQLRKHGDKHSVVAAYGGTGVENVLHKKTIIAFTSG